MDIFAEQLGLHPASDCHWPESATTWVTDTTSVPSVFDDSGASLTSLEDRSSLDLVSHTGKDMNVFSGIELSNTLNDEYTTGLAGLDGVISF